MLWSDPSIRSVAVNGKAVKLLAKEFDLLCLLAESPDQVFTRETILERIWGWDYEGTERTVDNFVANLRKKLRTSRTAPRIYRDRTPGWLQTDRASVTLEGEP